MSNVLFFQICLIAVGIDLRRKQKQAFISYVSALLLPCKRGIFDFSLSDILDRALKHYFFELGLVSYKECLKPGVE